MKESNDLSLTNLAGTLQREQDLVRQALKEGKSMHAWEILHRILARLVLPPVDSEKDARTITTTLDFSNLCFSTGQGFNELPKYLQSARSAADRLGDKRSLSLINLHLGRSYYLLNQWEEAVDCFVKGKKEVEDLGDEDIISQAAESLGAHYFFQGKFSKAMPYLESSAQDFESDEQDMIANVSSLIWLPCCAAFTGQFHNAIGMADYYRRIALERSRVNLAATLQSILGIILLFIRKNKDAIYQLSAALQQALETENTLAICLAKGGFAHHHFLEGRIEDARDWLAQCLEESKAAGAFIHYFSSLFYENVFEMHRQGVTVPKLDFKKVLHNALLGPNVHIQGIALRLRAMDALTNGEENSIIESNLELSERYLMMSGDQIQLAKTRVMMARHKLQTGDQKNARIMAQNAWKGFSGYGDIFFPNDTA
jgi:tetratricopeptide (TPR) repeat protein